MGIARALRACVQGDARALMRLHYWLTILWLVSAVPVIAIEGLRESIPLLVFISIYANVAGHFAAWQASRVEVAQEEAA